MALPEAGSANNNLQVPIGSTEEASIITGIYGTSTEFPEINILDIHGNIEWTWNATHAAQAPSSLVQCLFAGWGSATEVKGFSDHTKIAALYGEAAIVINHTPDNKESDKKIVWGICTKDILDNSHTLEALPEDWLAIATTGQDPNTDGLWIYDTSFGFTDSPEPKQKITGLPAVHGMIWDEELQVLWAVGTDKAANGHEPAYGLLNGYKFTSMSGVEPLRDTPLHTYRMPNTSRCTTEYPDGQDGGKYWDGPHDLVPIPHKRKFLIPSELDINAFDIESSEYTRGDSVVGDYFPGFVPMGNRTGTTPDNKAEELPRSDLKSVGVDSSGAALYVQAVWQTSFGDHINVLINKTVKRISEAGRVYRGRWFANIPGWETATWRF